MKEFLALMKKYGIIVLIVVIGLISLFVEGSQEKQIAHDAIAVLEELIRDDISTAPHKKEESSDGNNSDYMLHSVYPVVRIIDGDTIIVNVDGNDERVRIIGIDTPESVHPTKEVECFGKEASQFANSLLANTYVELIIDPSQDERDRFRRLLRYITLEDGRDFGFVMISQGYAFEYTYRTPHQKQYVYQQAEENARKQGLGMWAPNACSQFE